MFGHARHFLSLVSFGVVMALGGAFCTAMAQDQGADFASRAAEADSIQRHNDYLERSTAAQLIEVASLEQQIAGLDATGSAFAELLQRMFTELESFVTADLPFLNEERTQRIERLRGMMADESTVPAEKYRRLLEAYQIEMEYGRTMESYGGDIPGTGPVRFVRLGRVALMYTTANGEQTGYWDATAKSWVVDPAYDAGIQNAIRIALQEVTADLVTLPIPAASRGQ